MVGPPFCLGENNLCWNSSLPMKHWLENYWLFCKIQQIYLTQHCVSPWASCWRKWMLAYMKKSCPRSLKTMMDVNGREKKPKTLTVAYMCQLFGTDFSLSVITKCSRTLYLPLQSSQSAPVCWNQWFSHWKTTWSWDPEMNHWPPHRATQGFALLWHPNSVEGR